MRFREELGEVGEVGEDTEACLWSPHIKSRHMHVAWRDIVYGGRDWAGGLNPGRVVDSSYVTAGTQSQQQRRSAWKWCHQRTLSPDAAWLCSAVRVARMRS
eukprot:scaffold17639_cov30-Tisochrysis_lutea.AAC.5